MHAIFIVDPLTAIQAGTIWRGKVHVHFWWIVHVFPYSIWIESLFEGQWFSSVRLFPQRCLFSPFLGGRISQVFSPYSSSAPRMTRLDDPESWWRRWISLSFPLLCFLSVMKKDGDLLPSCKISTSGIITFPRLWSAGRLFLFCSSFLLVFKYLYIFLMFLCCLYFHISRLTLLYSIKSHRIQVTSLITISLLNNPTRRFNFQSSHFFSRIHSWNCDFATSQKGIDICDVTKDTDCAFWHLQGK